MKKSFRSFTPQITVNLSKSRYAHSVVVGRRGRRVNGAVFSTSIALEKDQKITQNIVQSVYSGYFGTLTIWPVVMVVIAQLSSVVIGKILAAGK
jgi:hypothetical protein